MRTTAVLSCAVLLLACGGSETPPPDTVAAVPAPAPELASVKETLKAQFRDELAAAYRIVAKGDRQDAVAAVKKKALAHYADAEILSPPGSDAPILRWNSCVRALQAVPDAGRPEALVAPDWDTDFVPSRR